jgi:hypothetical protein
MRILVVEDDKHIAGFVVRGLKEVGHLVEHAGDGVREGSLPPAGISTRSSWTSCCPVASTG